MLEIPVLSNHFLTTRGTELYFIFSWNRCLSYDDSNEVKKYSQNILVWLSSFPVRKNYPIRSDRTKNVIGSEAHFKICWSDRKKTERQKMWSDRKKPIWSVWSDPLGFFRADILARCPSLPYNLLKSLSRSFKTRWNEKNYNN